MLDFSFLCLQLLGRLPGKNIIFGSGKSFSGTVESGDCWGFSRVCCVHNGVKTPVKTVKKTGCIRLYWGVIVFFLPYRFKGLGERGGMALLHVNDPPFFTTPCEKKGPANSAPYPPNSAPYPPNSAPESFNL